MSQRALPLGPAAALLAAGMLAIPIALGEREVWVLNEGNRTIARVGADSETVFSQTIALGGPGTPLAAPFDLVFARLEAQHSGRYAFVTQGRFVRVVDASTLSVISTVDVGALLPAGLTLNVMRGASAGAPRRFALPGGAIAFRAHLFVAADVTTPAGPRPYYLVLDQHALAGVAARPVVVDHGALLPVPAEALQAEVLGLPDGLEFERAWFTVRETTAPQKLHAVLTATSRTLPAAWTIRRTRTTVLPLGAVVPIRLNVAASAVGSQLTVMYEPTAAAEAVSGRLINLGVHGACPPVADGSVTRVGADERGRDYAFLISAPSGALVPGEVRVVTAANCATTVHAVGRDPSDMTVYGEVEWTKLFVANKLDGTLSVIRRVGPTSPISSLLFSSPIATSLSATSGSSCAAIDAAELELIAAEPDAIRDDVQISWPVIGCSADVSYRVRCQCVVETGSDPCPPECGFRFPPSAVESLHWGGDWDDIGPGGGPGVGSAIHLDAGAVGDLVQYDVVPE